jgi:hypothetical protein
LPTHTVAPLPPSLPGDADPEQIHKRKRERKDAFNLNNLIKGLKKVMAFRLSQAERLLDEPQFYFRTSWIIADGLIPCLNSSIRSRTIPEGPCLNSPKASPLESVERRSA